MERPRYRSASACPIRPRTPPSGPCCGFSSGRATWRRSTAPRYVYSPRIPARAARRSAMRHVLKTFFGGSVEVAVATLITLEEGPLDDDERERIMAMIAKASEEGR
ncbi:MAG: BlaI/MecI/CopY family transcriptional regulator [Gemmatimonadota bacterium]|nr:BlaI/MecI/CopY family transcriptional regulator [Gemmatimonadota bacterium]MDE2985972.1 BlaI/MecI/CopY family transcriptional regulator [Gemmatimonadota bacterium]